MRGLWLEGGVLRLREDLPVPEPPPGEVRVRVLQAGVCNTDLELARGYYPYAGVPGHEFVGCVEAGPPDLVGQRVVGEINAACGGCSACTSGRRTHCARRTVLGIAGRNGAFAEYLLLPAGNLHRVPEGVSDDAAIFVEPLAAALQIQQQVAVGPAARVLVVGDGKLGLLIGQVLALTGCELLVVGRHPGKLARLECRGIRAGSAPEAAGGGFDIAVECTGNPEGFAIARRALRPRGILVMKSTYAGCLTVDAASLVVDEITLVGSRCGPFGPALRLLEQGRVEVESLICGRYSLDQGVAAFERAAVPGILKVAIHMGAG
ncbi:MAG: alcohol dehydrogenase catalytic domain-containing protein [Gemmatimonadota bacterium]